jgi:hypothetical protein
MRPLPLALLLASLCAAARAQSLEEPTPLHRGPALLVGLAGTYTETLRAQEFQSGAGGHLELGASLPVGYEENELFLMARAGSRGAPGSLLTFHGGLRSVFGREAWHTFADLGVVIHARPALWAGPRLALGLRRSFSESFSLYGGVGGQLGFGAGLRLDVEVFSGLRWGL